MAAFQGNFLSADVHHMVKNFILQYHRQRAASPPHPAPRDEGVDDEAAEGEVVEQQSYIDLERHSSTGEEAANAPTDYSRMNLVDVGCISSISPFMTCLVDLANTLHRLF